ncbi:TetR family transcriptional regulator [Candidatus Frankia alpina]|nr:TetR family transcriptional regulator [Candidatus Frankia alpina]
MTSPSTAPIATPLVAGGSGRGRARGDAEVSREAIIAAARRAFARQPYAAITLKAIAADAGVSAPLVLKYFGSKEQLFARVSRFGDEIDRLLDAPLPDLGRHLLHALLDAHEQRRDPLIRVAFALQHGEHAALLRDNFRDQVVARLRSRLTGPDAALRAELVLAHLLGLGVLRKIVHAEAISVAERDRIVDLCAPGLQRLLDGTP